MKLINNIKKPIAMATALSMTLGILAVTPIKAKAVGEPTTNNKRSVIYYGDWSIWGGQENFYPKFVSYDQYTDLNYAFLDFDAKGNLIFTDFGAACGASLGDSSVGWDYPNSGVLPALINLKANNPNCRIGVSVGGWSKSGDFPAVSKDPVIRKKFVDNLMRFVKYNDMDFLDIDWEYPGSVRQGDLLDNKGDEGTPNASPQDKEYYTTLLQAIRDGFNELSKETGKKYELSVALCAAPSVLDGTDIEKVFEIIDYGNLMSYDMAGAWMDKSGHQTALYANPNHPNANNESTVDKAVQYLLAHGAPSNKIVVGAAAYTRGWGKVSKGTIAGQPGLFGDAAADFKNADDSPSRGAINETEIKIGEAGYLGGIWGFRSITKLKTKYPGLVEYWDDYSKVPYLYSPDGAFFTYDNERSMREKAKYVQANNLGGIITWMASNDAPTDSDKRDALAKTVKNAFYGATAIPKHEITYAKTDVTATIKEVPKEWGEGVRYEVTLTNNETIDEKIAGLDDKVNTLLLCEKMHETIICPKLYIKADKELISAHYETGTVANKDGFTTVQVDSVYGLKFMEQGKSVKLYLAAADFSPVKISSIELTQKLHPDGKELRRQFLFDDGANKAPVISGAVDKIISVGEAFVNMAGVTATDVEDGNVTASVTVTGTVDTAKAGTYTLTYEVTDKGGLKATATRKITVEPINTPPVLNGVADKIIKNGETFNKMAGVTATDAEDGDITKDITVTGTVDTTKDGTYPLTYTVIDNKGAKATAKSAVTVQTHVNVRPEIIGVADKTIKFAERFDKLAGVTATDTEDGALTGKIIVSGNVDTVRAGTYTLTYTVADKEGLKATAIRNVTVDVAGNTPPVIGGLMDRIIKSGDSYDAMEGIIAKDNEDGDITKNIKVTGTVDTTKSGSYAITYEVEDSKGLKAKGIRIVTVGANTAPEIRGVSNKVIKIGELLNKSEGVTAIDAEDGDITPRMNILGSIDRMTPGTYPITYNVTDAGGLTTVVKCEVVVEKGNSAPTINGVENKTIKVGDVFDPMVGITATDEEDGSLAVTVGGTTVNPARAGRYTVSYTAIDSKGLKTIAKSVVTVEPVKTVKKPSMS